MKETKQTFSMDVEQDIDSAVEFSKLLAKYGIRGEFYITGELVDKFPDKVRFIGKNHILGGHGYYHEDFALLSARKADKVIWITIEAFRKNGLEIRGWRFPGLSYTNDAMNLVVKYRLIDSSIRENIWRTWGRVSFLRNWIRNLFRGIFTLPYPYAFKLKECPWGIADLNDILFYNKPGRLIVHCYNYKKYKSEIDGWLSCQQKSQRTHQ